MLTYLSVKNVSVIESVSFELKEGLTVLTGETGSGKSVLVNSLKLLLGDRFQKGMLRAGAEKLAIEGIFTGEFPKELAEQFESEGELLIRREVNEAGKNRIFINGISATVAQLKEFAPYLADIHGQHEHQTLLDESKHLELLDFFVPREVKEGFNVKYGLYAKAKKSYEEYKERIEESKKLQDIFVFQFNEIERAEINPNQDANIEEQVNYIAHREKIREACAVALDAVSEGEVNALELLSKASKSVSGIRELSQELAETEDTLNEALSRLNEAERVLSSLCEKQETSAEDLDKLLQRKYMLEELTKKYGGSLEAVLAFKEDLKERLSIFENGEGELARLESTLKEAKGGAEKEAEALLVERKKAGRAVAKEVVGILSDLELPNTRFEVILKKTEMNARGGVEGAFHISVNAGFEPAPLVDVASGGEISRVMLALKEVFSRTGTVETMLFDEIDTGISGLTARKVAEKLVKLSKNKQVIVITHLPVVAAWGRSHFYISKSMENNTTKTSIQELAEGERLPVLSRMITGDVTETGLWQAKELLEQKFVE